MLKKIESGAQLQGTINVIKHMNAIRTVVSEVSMIKGYYPVGNHGSDLMYSKE